jgi:3-oxoadipate enol-lactonase
MKIKVNNLSLNYAERGIPNGLPVVFIHGFPFSHTMWEPQMKALPNDIRAITYDVRGHGDSDVGDGQYSIEYFVDDLIGLLDHLVIQQAVVCGLSMGGYVALRAIERHPERFKALILCDTRSEPDGNEAKVKRAGQAKAVKANGTKEFAAGFVKAVFAQQSLDSKPEIVATIRSIIEATSPTGICGTLLAMAARTDTTPALSSIKVPTLILVGEHDTLTPPSASQAMKEKIVDAEMHIVPGAAHMSNLENAEFFNEKLIAFLKRL